MQSYEMLREISLLPSITHPLHGFLNASLPVWNFIRENSIWIQDRTLVLNMNENCNVYEPSCSRYTCKCKALGLRNVVPQTQQRHNSSIWIFRESSCDRGRSPDMEDLKTFLAIYSSVEVKDTLHRPNNLNLGNQNGIIDEWHH